MCDLLQNLAELLFGAVRVLEEVEVLRGETATRSSLQKADDRAC